VQENIVAGAKTAFLHGDQWAYSAGVVAILSGAVLVFFLFPRKQEEQELLERYHVEDAARSTEATEPEPIPPPAGAAEPGLR
jgi:hypothetical protein